MGDDNGKQSRETRKGNAKGNIERATIIGIRRWRP